MDAISALKPLGREEKNLEEYQTKIDASSKKIRDAFKDFQNLSAVMGNRERFAYPNEMKMNEYKKFEILTVLATELREYDILCLKTREKITLLSKTNFEFSEMYRVHYDQSVIQTFTEVSQIAINKMILWVACLEKSFPGGGNIPNEIITEIEKRTEEVLSIAHKQVIDWTNIIKP